jgi:hypothetical protein
MFSGRTHFARSLMDFKSSCTFPSKEITDGGNSSAMKLRMVGDMLLIEYFRLYIEYFLNGFADFKFFQTALLSLFAGSGLFYF